MQRKPQIGISKPIVCRYQCVYSLLFVMVIASFSDGRQLILTKPADATESCSASTSYTYARTIQYVCVHKLPINVTSGICGNTRHVIIASASYTCCVYF